MVCQPRSCRNIRLFDEQSREFDVEKRAEITRKMERILLDDLPDDCGYYWKSSMGYWNRVQNWPHFWARQCIITANLNRSGAMAARACELCEPTFYAGFC
jgi:hypothetical protein